MTSRYTYYTVEEYQSTLGQSLSYYKTYLDMYYAMSPKIATYYTYTNWEVYWSDGKYPELLTKYIWIGYLAYFDYNYGVSYIGHHIPLFAKTYGAQLELRGYVSSLNNIATVYGKLYKPSMYVYAHDHFYAYNYYVTYFGYSFSYSLDIGYNKYYLVADYTLHQMVPTQYYLERTSWPIMPFRVYYGNQSFYGTVCDGILETYYTYYYGYYNKRGFNYQTYVVPYF